MTKENEVWKEEKTVFLFFIICCIIIAILSAMVIFESLRYNDLQFEYYSYRAKVECPLMQYETNEENVIIMDIFNITKLLDYTKNNESYKYTCVFEKERVVCYLNLLKNFTTGRFVDGNIECLDIKTGQERCKELYEPSCPDKESWDSVCWFMCDLPDIIVKSQNFTLEEMGLK